MKNNMGAGDRVIRLAVSTILAVLCFQNIVTGVWAIVLGILAIIFFVTAFVGNCPLYLLFGINTCKKNNDHGTARN
ncbi:MAG: hypothetical protein JWQ30_1082 [Sediminibacterium sp.]|nr:hypothetical protein [Sediminibacterium sp.]